MIPTTEGINQVIRNNKDKIEVSKISDGTYTFEQLYARIKALESQIPINEVINIREDISKK